MTVPPRLKLPWLPPMLRRAAPSLSARFFSGLSESNRGSGPGSRLSIASPPTGLCTAL